jgi:glucose/arabinose dehydrogenase
MTLPPRLRWLSAALLLAAGSAAADPPLDIVLEPVATGLVNPIGVVDPGDGSGRLFVVLQGGQIRVIDGTGLRATPFLDLGALVSVGNERGLLGLAFHPEYASNGRFFVDYTDGAGDTVVARYEVSADPNVAEPGSAATVLPVAQPAANHNGGQLQFGPDGFLYIGTGDGGSFGRGEGEDSAGDPGNHAQDTHSLLGKILRIDVDLGDPYAIPEDNPFRDGVGGRPEVWAFGLRNPWRFSFDRENGDLFIGDVGETRREEIDRLPREVEAPANLGWRLMEGGLCFKPATGCHDRKTTVPLLEYSHYEGCAVIGGYRYRGSSYPKARGLYLFADFCKGEIRGAEPDPQGNWTWRPVGRSPSRVTSFGEDQEGELYITAFGEDGGILGRLELTNQPFQPETAPPDPLSIFE